MRRQKWWSWYCWVHRGTWWGICGAVTTKTRSLTLTVCWRRSVTTGGHCLDNRQFDDLSDLHFGLLVRLYTVFLFLFLFTFLFFFLFFSFLLFFFYLLFVFEFSVLLEDSRSCLTLVFHLFWTSFRFIFPADKHPVSFFLFLFSLKSGFTDMIVAIIVFFLHTALHYLTCHFPIRFQNICFHTETSNACVVLVPYLYQLGVIW